MTYIIFRLLCNFFDLCCINLCKAAKHWDSFLSDCISIQIRASPQAHTFFHASCTQVNIQPLELLLWIRTRWASLYRFLNRLLILRKVSFPNYAPCTTFRTAKIDSTSIPKATQLPLMTPFSLRILHARQLFLSYIPLNPPSPQTCHIDVFDF